MSEERKFFESQIRECYGRIVYTHKIHEKMADQFDGEQNCIKFWQILLSSITTVGVIGTIFSDTHTIAYITALISLAMSAMTLYTKNINPGGLAQKHRETASNIWDKRESYFSLLFDIHDDTIPLEALRKRRDALQSQLHEIYHSAPHTNSDAYKAAQDGLKNNEEMTFSEEEINKFMPQQLRRIKP